ncbi:hypothetical protein TVAG_475860 [Trichomonas vaginalis G3]|uniref:Uncharacterized protein n=1 Tax=Trichomonas vaginalis (strain ATCC PRA-98 / G3) TaxID=412133 RepID=A2DA10_TRIV3|nr:Ankyrin repeat family [Trichomonas vaginalis G3]EAY22658.1 hypothetical protein TVAG_475860 [Trichomonas vaginalis G3]KAI5525472.1 Ankyrin repeat family [Trichomonas vaginalis G3]|eukprot:XP_001583644.1 hypothetical protein [Trichomonas vaginalis G3]
MLSSISADTVEEIISFILENFNDDYETPYRLLLYFSSIRPKNIADLVKIWREIYKQTKITLSIIPITLENVYFADILYHSGVYSTEQVEHNAPYEKIDYRTYLSTFSKPPFKKSLKLSNLLKLYPEKSILYILKNDDVDSLNNMTLNQNFSIDMTVKPSVFDGYTDDNEISLLEAAAFYGSENCFKYLLFNSPNNNLSNSGKHCLFGGNFEIIRLANQNGCTFTDCLPLGIKYHRNEICSWLMENCSQCGKFTFLDAFAAFNTTAVVYLNEQISEAAIFKCCSYAYFPAFLSIIKRAENSVLDSNSIYKYLEMGCLAGSLPIVSYIFDNFNVDVNRCGKGKDFPSLHNACHGGSLAVVKYLVEKGADVNLQNDFKEIPLFYACYYGRYDCAEFLLDHGSTIPESIMRVPKTDFLVDLISLKRKK